VLYPLSYGGLPVSCGAPKAYRRRAEVDDRVSQLPDRAPRVLVVDDSDAVRDLLAVNLQLEGFDVRAAVDGQEGVEVAESWRPDVITLDVVMPRLGGFEAVERLRSAESTAHIPVVIVTGRAQADDRARGEDLGVDAYLTKPFEPADLVAVVRELAASGRRYP
jgi:CheY-like chemotaxis protein